MKGINTAVFSISSVVGLLSAGLIYGQDNFTETTLAAGWSSLAPILNAMQAQVHLVSQSNTSASSSLTNTTEMPVDTSTGDNNNTVSAKKPVDIFGITEIYPTKDGGRVWFVNMSNPVNSSDFSITDGANLTKLSDDAWRINASHVRMVVNTSGNQEKWKDVEITGYIRLSYLGTNQTEVGLNNTDEGETNGLTSIDENEVDDLVFIARSGQHTSGTPCEGTAYNGGLHTDGSVGWKKEIWHTGGYTDERANFRISDSFMNEWIGWKIVVYNLPIINNTTGVKLESYIDDSNSNNWTKVSEFIDSGGWYTISNNTEFFSADCGRARDHVILDAGPNIIFRTDNILLDFRDISVREIKPQNDLSFNSTHTNVLNLEGR